MRKRSFISWCFGSCSEAMMGSAPYPEADPRRCAIQVAHFAVIACVALSIFALVGYFLTVVLPWFLKVVVPMAWP